MQERRIRVSVIDDHRVFAEALAGRLSDEPDLEVVGTADAPAEAFELFSRNDVTAAADDSRAAEAVQMGVRGWVGKQGAIESLLTAVRGAARGEIHLPASILTRVLASVSERNRSREPEARTIAIFTARELEVLQGLTEGLSRNQIGILLDVSPNTVRTHIHSILHKLNVHSALAAVAFARRAAVGGLRDMT